MGNSYLKYILFCLLLAGCTKAPMTEEEAVASANASPSENELQEVVVRQVEMAPLAVLLSGSGKIVAANLQKLVFQKSGLLKTLMVSNGSSVSSGALIAQLENQQELLALDQARLAYRQALYTDEDERMFLNDSAFYKEKWSEVDEKTALKSGVPQAQVELEIAQLALDQTKIVAPLSGIVSQLSVKPGELVKANQPMGKIYDPKNFRIDIELLEYDFAKARIGQQVEISALAMPKKSYSGKVVQIDPTINSAGYFQVTIAITGRIDGLVPGMSAVVSIRSVSEESHLIIPLTAVVNRSGRTVVFTYEEGLAKWNYVVLGNQNGEQVEVLDGLDPSSRVIISNVFQLAHDSPVAVIKDAEITSGS